MKTLTKAIQEILAKNKVESPFPDGAHLIPDLIQAVKERDAFIIGKNLEPELKEKKLRPEASLAEYGAFINYVTNNLRIQQRKRAEESL